MSFKDRVVNGSVQFLDEQRAKLKQTEVWQTLMGAGAVSGQAPQPSSTQGSMSPRSNASDRATSLSCESCATSFTIFKRRKVCMDCCRNLCSTCLPKEPDKPSNHRKCEQCLLLATGIFTRQDLDKFKAKHLKNYLNKRNIPIENCKEKNDLIEILMLFSRHSEHFRELEEHQRHFQQLQERMRENSILGFNNADGAADRDSSSSATPPSSTQATPSMPRHAQGGSTEEDADRQLPQEARGDNQRQVDETEDAGRRAPNSQPPADAPRVPPTHVTPTLPRHAPDGSTTETDEERLQRLERRRQQEMRETQERLGHRLMDDDPPDPRPRKQRMSIGQLAREESIDELSIKQLKEILVTNFVDYKGCVEKKELIERVKRLWNQKTTKEDSDDPNNESDECRICMDASIDCVLLECGHMVTCTSCGRRLAECPICRQYVSRVVHTFKA